MFFINHLTMCRYSNSVNAMCSAGGAGQGSGAGPMTATDTGSATVIHDLTHDIFGSDTDSVGSRHGEADGDGDGDSHDDDDDDDDLLTDSDDDDDDDEYDNDDWWGGVHVCRRPLLTPYIGLKQLAHVLGMCAHKLSVNNRLHLAEPMYMDALAIDPFHDFVGNMGIMYETRFKNVELAKKYYLMAINEGDELSMYNLADLYYNEKNNELMVQYFEMAVQHGDDASRKRLILHYHSVGDMPNFARHYYLQLAWSGDDADDADYWDGVDESHYSKFQKSHNSLTLAAQLDRGETRDNPDVVRLLDSLRKTPQYCAFKNKVALFTRLNHVVECGICYDNDKVNIDIHCGHTVCVDCYTQLYDKVCPFCRQAP
jgi:TPR repeat protein